MGMITATDEDTDDSILLFSIFQTNDGSSFQITDRGFLSFISAPIMSKNLNTKLILQSLTDNSQQVKKLRYQF